MTNLLLVLGTFALCQNMSNAASFLEINSYADKTPSVVAKLEEYVNKFKIIVATANAKIEDRKNYYDDLISKNTPVDLQNGMQQITKLKSEINSIKDEDGKCEDKKNIVTGKLGKLEGEIKACHVAKGGLNEIKTNLDEGLNSIVNDYKNGESIIKTLVSDCDADKKENTEKIKCVAVGLNKFNTKWEEIKQKVTEFDQTNKDAEQKIKNSGQAMKKCIQSAVKDQEIFTEIQNDVDDYSICASLPPPPSPLLKVQGRQTRGF